MLGEGLKPKDIPHLEVGQKITRLVPNEFISFPSGTECTITNKMKRDDEHFIEISYLNFNNEKKKKIVGADFIGCYSLPLTTKDEMFINSLY